MGPVSHEGVVAMKDLNSATPGIFPTGQGINSDFFFPIKFLSPN